MKHKKRLLILLVVLLLGGMAMPLLIAEFSPSVRVEAALSQEGCLDEGDLGEMVMEDVSANQVQPEESALRAGEPDLAKLVIPALAFHLRPHEEAGNDLDNKIIWDSHGCLAVDPAYAWGLFKDQINLVAHLPLPDGTRIRQFELNIKDANPKADRNFQALVVRYEDNGASTVGMTPMLTDSPKYPWNYGGGPLKIVTLFEHTINSFTTGKEYAYVLIVKFPPYAEDLSFCSVSVIYEKPSLFRTALPHINK